jgi:hypothetical protein
MVEVVALDGAGVDLHGLLLQIDEPIDGQTGTGVDLSLPDAVAVHTGICDFHNQPDV